MATGKLDIYVFAHWKGMQKPQLIGTLSALYAKGRKAFSFEYEKGWVASKQQMLLDPDIQFYTGPQYPNNKVNFGVFLDSMPDTWGRTLMKRKEVQRANEEGERARTLYEVDYLLGVYDESRMGGLRFKTDINGPFLDDNDLSPTPPWSSIRELQEAAKGFENEETNDDVKKWLDILMAPGSSLGGARPKANILDENNEPWIAKFPSKNDTTDKAAWEYLAYRLALKAGIHMAPSRIEKVSGQFNTFFTKRFDREEGERVHFASAMTMTGNNEGTVRDQQASYLDMAEFIQNQGAMVNENLEQLWRRIVFNIAISNTDDHLRNHGFILTSLGWVLSPAYDLNPSIDKDGLSLNIDVNNNELDYGLAKSVGLFFRLTEPEMNAIIAEVISAVTEWKKEADALGISRREQEIMSKAFNI
ncbi:MAG: toxin HipA [Flavobacteriales bacterium 32-35-8]|nr:MAG: toxin HipA [Flavobacteriales bacterium 32-35-8]